MNLNYKNIAIILLSAGKSSRTSTPKQLYRIGNKRLIEIQIETLLFYGFENIYVILGYYFEKIKKYINPKVKIIFNENYKDGMFSSIKKGLETIKDEKFIFIHPIDTPIPKREVFIKLLESGSISIPTYQAKKGHPLLIEKNFITSILNTKEIRLDFWLKSKNIKLVEVDDEKIILNANYEEDLKKVFGN